MKTLLASFVSGIVFALGLGISGMTRPVKVIGFLDFLGQWDASLAFVMLGGIAVYFLAYRLSETMSSPLLAPDFSIPKRSDLDARLILGGRNFWRGLGTQRFLSRALSHFARVWRISRICLRRCDGNWNVSSCLG
jgi:uncharacterized membrane protein YedE/YeeE